MDSIKQSENVLLTGPLIVEQANVFLEPMGINTTRTYSTGWLRKFKLQHGIPCLQIGGERARAR